jgi:DNA-binding CsgD family transcriptional regulator
MLETAIASAAEAISLDELEAAPVRQLAHSVNACSAILFGFGPDGKQFGVGTGGAQAMREYVEGGYFRDDPHDRIGRRDHATVRIASDLIDRKELHRSRAFKEFFTGANVDYTANCRLSASGFGEPGAVCVLVMQQIGKPDFTQAHRAMMERAMPAFQSAVRRHQRIQSSLNSGKMLETILETLIGDPVVLFDKQGHAVWRSNRAREIVELSNGAAHPLSDSLRREARKLAASTDDPRAGRSSRYAVEMPGNGNRSIEAADLLLARDAPGNTYVVARLRQSKTDAVKGSLIAEHYGLTPTESTILGDIAEGCSNQEIADRRKVSLETARTHVHRVLQKLGVSSRVKAAMMAGGGS